MSSDGRRLEGKVALVTGAGRGIGRAYAQRLGALGAAVAVLDRNLRSYEEFAAEAALMTADSTVGELEAAGVRAIGVEADITDEAAVKAAVAEVVREFRTIDVAVCNAGGGSGPVTESKASEVDAVLLDEVVRRNLYGTIFTCKAVADVMKRSRSGSIVTVASTDGVRSLPGGAYAHYSAAKAAVIMYTRCLAQDLGPYNIRANVICPGFIETGRIQPKIEEMDRSQVESEMALRRIGTPEEMAGVVEFLATDLSAYVTGRAILADGGWLAS